VVPFGKDGDRAREKPRPGIERGLRRAERMQATRLPQGLLSEMPTGDFFQRCRPKAQASRQCSWGAESARAGSSHQACRATPGEFARSREHEQDRRRLPQLSRQATIAPVLGNCRNWEIPLRSVDLSLPARASYQAGQRSYRHPLSIRRCGRDAGCETGSEGAGQGIHVACRSIGKLLATVPTTSAGVPLAHDRRPCSISSWDRPPQPNGHHRLAVPTGASASRAWAAIQASLSSIWIDATLQIEPCESNIVVAVQI